jgi:hypothetical protein
LVFLVFSVLDEPGVSWSVYSEDFLSTDVCWLRHSVPVHFEIVCFLFELKVVCPLLD